MRMLCIAAQHDPTGYVSINRVGLDPEGIARFVGVGVDEVRSLIGELSLNGVFTRDRNGTIYNRRMVRDAKKSAACRKNGKEGGNPEIRRGTVPKSQRSRPYRRSDNPGKTKRIWDKGQGKCHWCKAPLIWESEDLVPNLFHVDHLVPICDGGSNDESNLVSACASCNHARARNDWEKPPDTNPHLTSDTMADPNLKPIPIPKKDTDSSLRSESCSKRVRATENFERFYSGYPKKVNRKAAARKFEAAVESGVDPELIVAAAVRFAEAHRNARTEKQFIPAPDVWLNKGRWDDEDLPHAPRAGPASNGRSNGMAGALKTVFGIDIVKDYADAKQAREESSKTATCETIPFLQLVGDGGGKGGKV